LEAGVLLMTTLEDGPDHYEELELDAAVKQLGFKVLHTLSEEINPGLVYAFASHYSTKTSWKTLALPPR
jgi:hypothetical protein